MGIAMKLYEIIIYLNMIILGLILVVGFFIPTETFTNLFQIYLPIMLISMCYLGCVLIKLSIKLNRLQNKSKEK